MPFNVCGLIRAKVYNQDGSLLKNAEDYFFEMDDMVGLYWEIISNNVSKHVAAYFPKWELDKNSWQAGFGGDEGSGLIDFALQSHPPAVPDMEFEIENKKYIMKFGEPYIE